MNRRTVIGAGAALLSTAGRTVASAAPPIAPATIESLPLWPSGSPGLGPTIRLRTGGSVGNRILTEIDAPSLAVYRPASGDGSALIIVPGGGYMQENIDIEGTEIAKRFNQAGIAGFVLTYRLPSEGWPEGPVAPLKDALRAVRIVRTNARAYGLDPARIGAIGFSAGGHLVASLAMRSAENIYAPIDEIDRADPRPSFFALGYPVVTMLPPFAHEASVEHLLGKTASNELRQAWSAERYVSQDTPPGFLFGCADDPYVPIENTTMLFAAMRAKQVRSEMHIFERGGHGFGLRLAPALPATSWPDLLLRWGRSAQFFRGLQPEGL